MGRPPGSNTIWTPDVLERLRHLRDDLNLTWREIGAAMGIGGPKCAAAYYRWFNPNGRESLRKRQLLEAPPKREKLRQAVVVNPPPDDSPIYGGGRVPERTPADQAVTRVGAAEPSPVWRRYLGSMQDDVLLRVQRQGITAGLLGDPPPGRSALDQKRAGADA